MGQMFSQLVAAADARVILLVEDELLIRLAMAEDLMAAGFQVLQAGNADEALRILQSSISVDLVMTDIRMPGSIDGVELAMQIRSQWPQLKIVVVSGHLQAPPSEVLVDLFFPKPYAVEVVLEKIRQLLDGDGQGQWPMQAALRRAYA